ncbi:GAS2-like protein 1 [Neolecta irregularis DAH-3]|uniref:GAS2-like protein 1 n=1 Tax=Neolecta irregularis (strain DAH-3) TaxID=1198029 RepID=A0A1U7LIP4_NEOID|nr:GAS2-like protein 1 [Neolecta irregularis DAH-3]|eukprot:OLL22525.1 GAS2-like protein 1 [Neolecta irregularis DAH-3]
MPLNTSEISIPPLLNLIRSHIGSADKFGQAALKAVDPLLSKAHELSLQLPLDHPLHRQVSLHKGWVHEIQGIGTESAWAKKKIYETVAELNSWSNDWSYENLNIGKTIHRIISIRKDLEMFNINGLKGYVRAAQAESNLTPPALLMTSLLLYILPPLAQLNRLLILWTSRCEVSKLYPIFMDRLQFCESAPDDINAFFNAAKAAGCYLDDMLDLTMEELPSEWLDRMDLVDEKVDAALKTIENEEIKISSSSPMFDLPFEGDSIEVKQEQSNVTEKYNHGFNLGSPVSIPQTPLPQLGNSSPCTSPPLSSPTANRRRRLYTPEYEGLSEDDIDIAASRENKEPAMKSEELHSDLRSNNILPSRNLSKHYIGLASYSDITGSKRKPRRDATASTFQSNGADSIFDESRSSDSASEPEVEATKKVATPITQTIPNQIESTSNGTRPRRVTNPIGSATAQRAAVRLANKKSSPAMFIPSLTRTRTPIQKSAAFKALQKTSLDRKISKIVEELPVAMKLTREDQSPPGDLEDGIYQLHHKILGPTSLYCRVLSDRVMVRVGGGWSDLESYLLDFATHHSRANIEFNHSGAEATQSTSRNQTSRPGSRLTRPESRFSVRCATPDTFDGRPDTPVTPHAPLGLAGPQSKLFDQTSPEKLAWVEDVATKLRQNKKLIPSAGPTRVYAKQQQSLAGTGRNTPSRYV